MTINLAVYFSAAAAGVPLVFVVFGLVWWAGRAFQLQGVTKYLTSLLAGLLLGGLYMLSATRPPAGDWWLIFGYWFGVGVYGLGLGVLTSVLHDAGQDWFARSVRKAVLGEEGEGETSE